MLAVVEEGSDEIALSGRWACSPAHGPVPLDLGPQEVPVHLQLKLHRLHSEVVGSSLEATG